MNISFTGVQNIAGVFENPDRFNKYGEKIVVQLTDEGTKHLSLYKDVFEKFPDRFNKGFLNIENVHGENRVDAIFINGKQLKIKNENVTIIEKITNLLSNIINEKFLRKVDKDYLNSHICSINILNKNISSKARNQLERNNVKMAHDKDIVQAVAQEVNVGIQTKMAKYFGYNYDDVKLNDFFPFDD